MNKNKLTLFSLLVFSLLTRILMIFEGIIPFSFDHGKDSLAVMAIVKTYDISLIGPWTSIPGLFFGPAWYYLLAPFHLFGNLNPAVAPLLMICLLLVLIYLMCKHVSTYSAFIIASAPYWFTISISAWNPFPMAIITAVLIIILTRIKHNFLYLNWKNLFLLGLFVSLGFHFSSAYAIFLLPIVLTYFIVWRVPFFTFKNLLYFFLGVLIPFLPQIVFELRNNFIQTVSIINFLTNKSDNLSNISLLQIFQVFKQIWGEVRLAILPEIRLIPISLSRLLTNILLISSIFFIIKKKLWKYPRIKESGLLVAMFVLIPGLGLCFLHFNVWYLVGMMPICVYFLSTIIEKLPNLLKTVWISLYLLGAISMVINFHLVDKFEHANSKEFMPVKLKAIKTIRDIAQEENFSSYHYVSDIYDFSYQYLYLMDAFHGKRLPLEFSYEPNVTSYITQKDRILLHLNFTMMHPESNNVPKYIFFIVEKPENELFLNQWWQRQIYSEIIDTISISESVTLFVATP